MKKSLGDFGELKAREYLTKKRYKLLETNYRTRLGEIDIIAEKKDMVIFVEVKTRSGDAFGSPAEAVTAVKRKRIINMAKMYMMRHEGKTARFDIIEVTVGERPGLNHIENAFWEGLS